MAQQVGGSSCQDNNKAARLKHNDAGIKSLPEGNRGEPEGRQSCDGSTPSSGKLGTLLAFGSN